MKKKIYISGAITGTDDYKERFHQAECYLTRKGYEVINPTKLDLILPENTQYEEYMHACMALIELADAVYMLDGWQDSKEANREYGKACGLGMKLIFERKKKVKENEESTEITYL